MNMNDVHTLPTSCRELTDKGIESVVTNQLVHIDLSLAASALMPAEAKQTPQDNMYCHTPIFHLSIILQSRVKLMRRFVIRNAFHYKSWYVGTYM